MFKRYRPWLLGLLAVLCLVGSLALDAQANRIRIDGYPTLRKTTTSGAPSTGCCSMVGDLAVDSDGVMYHCSALGCPGTWIAHGSGTGDGDFLADGTVPMTGDLDLDGSDVINVGAGNVSVETLAGNVDGLVTDVDDIITTPQCHSVPFGYADGSSNDFDIAYGVYNATDHQPYTVLTSNGADQDFEVGGCFCVPAYASAFDATSAVTLTYKLSDGTGGNGLKLRVRGTDGATCYTSAAGVATAETVITATAANLSTCVKTVGGLICITAFIDTLDAADTASVGLITLAME